MEKNFKIFNRILCYICMLLLLLEVVIVAGVAGSRYVFRYTPAWGETLALLFGVWFVFLGGAYAISEDVHLKMTLLDSLASEKVLWYLEWIGLGVTAVLGVSMFVYGTSLLNIASRNIMTGLGLPSTVLYSAVPVSGICFIVEILDRGRKLLCQHR